MMWNQEYFMRVSEAVKAPNRSFTNVVFGPGPLIVPTFPNSLIVVVDILLFI